MEMKNFEKYEEEIKKYKYNFKVYKNEVLECDCDCNTCDFYKETESCCIYLVEWLYEEYNPKAKLTIKEIEELLKDKYPNGIEVVK